MDSKKNKEPSKVSLEKIGFEKAISGLLLVKPVKKDHPKPEKKKPGRPKKVKKSNN